MKKLILLISILSLMFIGCSDDDTTIGPADCVALATGVSTALETYEDEMNQANCDANYAALQAWFDAGCEGSDTFTQENITAGAEACAFLGD